MKLSIQTPDFKAQKQLTDFVKNNVIKLAAASDRIIQADILLKLDKSDKKENKICELRLMIPGNDLFAAKRSDSFEDAVQKCIEAIKHQIGRWKDSVNNGKLRGSVAPFEPEETSM